MHDAQAITAQLSTESLARRLSELALAERRIQVEFLEHLDEFDRRRAYLEAGYASLWEYCLRALHLREGAAGRRIGAMRVLRRFPALRDALRDGRLCLSTASLLGQVLTVENLEDLVARAAHKTKEEVDHLVATLRPRVAPREGLRQLPNPAPERVLVAAVAAPSLLGAQPIASGIPATKGRDDRSEIVAVPTVSLDSPPEPEPCVVPSIPQSASAPLIERQRPATQVRATSEQEWSLTVTLDVAAKKELELLRALLSHKCGRNMAAVLREAVRCGIEKHGKRRGVVAPKRSPRRPPEARSGKGTESDEQSSRTRSRSIPIEVRRKVFERDGGSCTWIGHGGRRCGSRHQIEVDHIQPFEKGGPSTIENLRLLCKAHNLLYAERIFGKEQMARFKKVLPGTSPPRSLERVAPS